MTLLARSMDDFSVVTGFDEAYDLFGPGGDILDRFRRAIKCGPAPQDCAGGYAAVGNFGIDPAPERRARTHAH